MSQNQEIIESKLCAYIDGELDPEGRAEIERHLEANPQHRRLLESLRATRDLIRWLPREPAPPEVAETLSGQLERSVLLNYEGDSLRISPWPRIMAAAAIILLTAGLGVAVYYTLPRSQKSAQLAFHSPSPDSGGDVVPAPTTLEGPSHELADAVDPDRAAMRDVDKMKEATPEDLRKDGGPIAAKGGFDARNAEQRKVAEADSKNVAELDQLAVQVGQDPAAFLASAENGNNNTNNVSTNNVGLQTAFNTNANSNALVLLVRSNAPEQVQKQLTSYLNDQQIQWRQAPLQTQSESLTKNGAGSLTLNRADVDRMQENEKRESNRSRLATTQPADLAKDDTLSVAPSDAANATTPPAQLTPFAGATAPPSSQAKSATQSLYGDVRQAGQANNASFNGVYVCQMSRRQAAELSSTISNDAASGTQVQDVNAVAYNANFQQSAAQNSLNLNNVQATTLAAGGYGGGGGSAGNEQQQRSLYSTPTEHSQLMDRQSITAKTAARDEVPTTRPVDAPARAVNAAQSAGTPALAPAATQPTGPIEPLIAGAMPATNPSQFAAAVTTCPADRQVNVVIMVQPNSAGPAAAQLPSTQPAGEEMRGRARARGPYEFQAAPK